MKNKELEHITKAFKKEFIEKVDNLICKLFEKPDIWVANPDNTISLVYYVYDSFLSLLVSENEIVYTIELPNYDISDRGIVRDMNVNLINEIIEKFLTLATR